jgi:hypothetical protein
MASILDAIAEAARAVTEAEAEGEGRGGSTDSSTTQVRQSRPPPVRVLMIEPWEFWQS